jgi:PAS domain S-box-containing protein
MAFEHLTKKELLRKMESLRLEVAEYEKDESEKLYEEKLYRSLAVTAEAGVYIVKGGIFRFVNQFTASRLGCNPTELIGMKAVDFIHPEDREMIGQKASDMLRGKRSAPYEFRTIGKDGKIHWILESVTSIEFGAGRAILGQSMDITKQVDARSRLAELEALEASILESIPHAVIGLKNRQIIFANDGVEKVGFSTARRRNGPSGRTTSIDPWRRRGPSPRRLCARKKTAPRSSAVSRHPGSVRRSSRGRSSSPMRTSQTRRRPKKCT